MTFDLIDEIIELEPGRKVVARTAISADATFFEDHFPGFPVVPGVLLTEMMGQSASKALDTEMETRGKAILAKIESATFRDWVGPGQNLEFRAEIKLNRPKFAKASCQAFLNEKQVASADLLFSFVPLDKFAIHYRDRALDAFLARKTKQAGQ